MIIGKQVIPGPDLTLPEREGLLKKIGADLKSVLEKKPKKNGA